MSSRTRIIVLHKKEVIYTVIFAVFGVALLCLLFLMFSSGQKKEEQQPGTYTAGVYSSSVQLGIRSLTWRCPWTPTTSMPSDLPT